MILAILQARMSSSRLPGKVMMPILGKPSLERQIERILRSQLIDQLVVATSENNEDDCVELLAKKLKVGCYRGNLNDVLGRFYNASLSYKPQHVVRLTGDCPLTDSKVIDETIMLHLRNNFSYTSNIAPPTFPDGLDVEVFQSQLLKEAHQFATLAYDREHVTTWIRSQDHVKKGNYVSAIDYSNQRWTLDTQQDYDFINEVYQRLYPHKFDFDYQDILQLINTNPELIKINEMHIASRVGET